MCECVTVASRVGGLIGTQGSRVMSRRECGEARLCVCECVYVASKMGGPAAGHGAARP